MSILTRTIDSLAQSSGLKAIIGRFAPGRILDDVARQAETHNPPATPNIPVVNIDQATRNYLLARHYKRPYSFAVFSSEARHDMPNLHDSVEALRNEENKLNLRLSGNRFSAMAECAFENLGYELRVTNVIETDYEHH